MNLRKFNNKKLKDFTMCNEAGSTRYGFYHKSTLFYKGIEWAVAKCNYLNRTWECYTFQSSMMCAVGNLKEKRTERLISDFKYNNNIKRLTEKTKKELEKILKSDQELKECELMLKELREWRA